MKSRALMAKTHPPEYLIHKYWARKPYNILQNYIKHYFKKGDIILDPFCGSGVFLAEAKKQDMKAIGFDINPIAWLISEVTTNPPDISKLQVEIEKLLDNIKNQYASLYTIQDIQIRYSVHEINTLCPICNEEGSPSRSRKKGNKYYCLKCNNKLSFNLEKFTGTSIVQVYDRNNTQYNDPNLLSTQEKLSNVKNFIEVFNRNLLINRRILAFPGMKVANLFTPRAFTILSNIYQQAHKISDEKVKNAVLLFLSSSVAQCSRLIPHRNNLSTGGPAWTIPGFWVAPVHLETNPIIHLDARYKKFIKGITALISNYKIHNEFIPVRNIPAQDGLKTLKNNSLDGIFFDPPYGDNVPYVEFSEIWNSFLKINIDYQNEIIVSDRKEYVSSWDKYGKDIEQTIELFNKKLKNGGKVIMTFNNLDPRAWKIVLESFAKYPFKCVDAKYQIPAVISSKSQKASKTSYIGDYYCVFVKGNKNGKYNNDLYILTDKIRKTLISRGGIAPKNLINRVAILTILNENLNINFIDKIQEAILPIAINQGEFFKLRDGLVDELLFEEYDIKKIVQKIAIQELKQGKKDTNYLYEAILERTDDIGNPLLSEVIDMLNGIVFFDKGYCYLQNDNIEQFSLLNNSL